MWKSLRPHPAGGEGTGRHRFGEEFGGSPKSDTESHRVTREFHS